MTLATLAEVLQPALAGGYAVPGLVCLGWEDARAYVAAAEAEGAPVILQAGPSCRGNTPVPVLAAMFRHLAQGASVPVVAHLDHGKTVDECREALEYGFTSVMIDGSSLPLDDNIALTAEVAALARAAGAGCEGEIGFVGYDGGAQSRDTDPAEAARFAAETGVDAMAVSVGNVHLMTEASGGVNRAALAAIEAATEVPLVLHGGSGIPPGERARLASASAVCKFNIGTELRTAFGKSLREALAAEPRLFDRIEILRRTEPALIEAARGAIRSVGASCRAPRS